jgi:hypothetical protein
VDDEDDDDDEDDEGEDDEDEEVEDEELEPVELEPELPDVLVEVLAPELAAGVFESDDDPLAEPRESVR